VPLLISFTDEKSEPEFIDELLVNGLRFSDGYGLVGDG
jgi:hypothetical protein